MERGSTEVVGTRNGRGKQVGRVLEVGEGESDRQTKGWKTRRKGGSGRGREDK